MSDVYGRVSVSQLLPRERDVTSGRLTARRDDKRRHDKPRDDSGHAPVPRRGSRTRLGSPSITPRVWWSVAGAAVLLVAIITGAVAVAGRPSQTPTALTAEQSTTAEAPSAAGGPKPASASPAVSPSTLATAVPTEPPATAIRLDYAGGTLVKKECSDAAGTGKCFHFDTQYDPLVVRCTPKDCLLYAYGRSGSIRVPIRLSGDVQDPTSDCAPTHWTIKLSPVGESVTEGIRHPARLVGMATASRPAQLLGKFNCLGSVEVYRVNATPS